MNARLIIICHACRQPGVDWKDKSGKPPCKASGKHFMEHVAELTCPMGKYTPTHLPEEIPVDYDVNNATKGRCCS